MQVDIVLIGMPKKAWYPCLGLVSCLISNWHYFSIFFLWVFILVLWSQDLRISHATFFFGIFFNFLIQRNNKKNLHVTRVQTFFSPLLFIKRGNTKFYSSPPPSLSFKPSNELVFHLLIHTSFIIASIFEKFLCDHKTPNLIYFNHLQDNIL